MVEQQDKERQNKPNGGAEKVPPNGKAGEVPSSADDLSQEQQALPEAEEAVVPEEIDPTERILELEKALSDAESKAQEYQQQLLRLRADYDNLRRRVTKEREEFLHFAGEALVKTLLPVLDDFELALKSPGEELSEFLRGVEMIYRQLYDILTREGLSVLPAVGEEFDPGRHEAVAFETSDQQPPNTVVAELRRGYTFRGKVIRPALVKVSKAQDGSDQQPDPEAQDG